MHIILYYLCLKSVSQLLSRATVVVSMLSRATVFWWISAGFCLITGICTVGRDNIALSHVQPISTRVTVNIEIGSNFKSIWLTPIKVYSRSGFWGPRNSMERLKTLYLWYVSIFWKLASQTSNSNYFTDTRKSIHTYGHWCMFS